MQRHILVIFINICRFLLALTFLFSGFVKAVDPLGMATKLQAYFAHWQIHISEHSLILTVLAVSIAVAEFMLGVYLFLGMRRKFSSVATFSIMVAMTVLTLYIYFYNPVPDCGCFGDAIKLSNGESLLKNIVLLGASAFVVFFPQHIRRLVSERNQWATSIVAFIYIFSLSLYSRHYLPALDFTAYKVGTDIRSARNGTLGEEAFEEYANLWMMGTGEVDLTDSLLNDSGYTFLLTSPNLESADDGISDRINDLHDLCADKHIRLYMLTASDSTAIGRWIDRTGAAYPFLLGEKEQIEAMVHSNPGLLLLKDGHISGKWSANNLPSEEDFDTALKPQPIGMSQQVSKLAIIFFVPLFFVIFADNIWVGSKYFKRHRQRRKHRIQ